MAGKVVNSSFVLLSKFGVNRQETASKTATSHMCAESNEQLVPSKWEGFYFTI